MPSGALVVNALRGLDFEFEHLSQRDVTGMRGFAPEIVIDVVTGSLLEVTMLCSTSMRRSSIIRSSLCMATLADVLGVDFTGWLARQMAKHDNDARWKASRRFGSSRMSAELLSLDAMVITIQVPYSVPTAPNVA